MADIVERTEDGAVADPGSDLTHDTLADEVLDRAVPSLCSKVKPTIFG